MKNIIFLVAALIAACSAAACTSSVTATQRPDTWQVGAGTGAIFDIVVTNSGSCPLTFIGLSISVPEGATINNYWNLQASSLYWLVDPSSYENLLPSGAVVNTGMVVNFPGAPEDIAVNVYGSTCPEDCAAEGSEEPTEAPTDAPTTGPTDTPVEPTDTPTVAPTEEPAGSCNIGASLRLGSSWTTDGVEYASYHLFLTNNGECGLKDYVTSFGLNGGEIISTWNLASSRGGYLVQGYGEVLHPGDSYGGAGFNVKLGGDISITPYGSNCQC